MTTGELAPSIISADLARLGEQLASVEPYARRWHVDVMDGHYVPNVTIGPSMVAAISRMSPLPQDVHLMITNPDASWRWYAEAGAARIAFHPQTSPDPRALLFQLRQAGLGPGVALNPDEPVSAIEGLLDVTDHVVVMSVHPGFSGQRFIPEVLPKLGELKSLAQRQGGDVQLVVDGGVSPETAAACVEAGADVLVSASAIFGAKDPAGVAERLAGSWEAARPA